jgi:hypothetical protein
VPQHLLAGFFAAAALVRARLHVPIVGETNARFLTPGAGLGTGVTDQIGKWPLPRNNPHRAGANVSTIPARLERFHMLGFASSQEPYAVRRTRFAFTSAGIALCGTFFISSVVCLMPLSFPLVIREGTAREGGNHDDPRKYQSSFAHHDASPLNEIDGPSSSYAGNGRKSSASKAYLGPKRDFLAAVLAGIRARRLVTAVAFD